MTDREKAIVMAHTGVCMLAGEKFGVFHAYIEDIMGRPVYTHELAIQSISDEIKEKSRDDFIKLCKEAQEPCEDAISREDALMCLTGEIKETDTIETIIARFARRIRKLPPVNPTKTGRWIEHPEIETSTPEYLMFYECSECGDKQCFCKPDIHKKHFCNNCGARMVEPQERSEEE